MRKGKDFQMAVAKKLLFLSGAHYRRNCDRKQNAIWYRIYSQAILRFSPWISSFVSCVSRGQLYNLMNPKFIYIQIFLINISVTYYEEKEMKN